ncbi:MAG: MOSC domain-containing protein [Firmicutes bacterium]|nr:MOSC domain-containing protein [Bacillota bacterium]
MTGQVVGIKISEIKKGPSTSLDEANLIADFGIEGDCKAGKGHRQVSLLASESIEKMKSRNISGLCSGKFSENITTAQVSIWEFPVTSRVLIGEVVMEISQIGKECHDGCEIKAAYGQCVMPKEGVFAKVIQGGRIKVGDAIRVDIPTDSLGEVL